jgi:phosphoribosyl-ATP pyrophosphohydrolase/phosphoribosyl-AMP cyclohydrolase
MRILPAIDLLDAKVVRLHQGRYDHITTYPVSPTEIAHCFQKKGLNFLHVIDLDGAKNGLPALMPHIKQLLEMKLSLQVGGGIRTLETARSYLQLGVDRIIVSTSSIEQEGFWQALVAEFSKERIVLALDVKNGQVLTHGWCNSSKMQVDEIIEKIGQGNILHLIVTDTQKDGTNAGPNLALYKEIRQKFPTLNLIAAGGISSVQDILALEKLGIDEAVVGRAIYENPTLIHYLLCEQIDWQKGQGLVPAIVQSADDAQVLMLGYMNKEALNITLETKQVTFFSRSRQTLWTKGKSSGNTLKLVDIAIDCDKDTLLVLVEPAGPVCHEGTKSCFNAPCGLWFLHALEKLIDERFTGKDPESYVFKLSQKGPACVAQKVGEEAVETALASLMPSKNQLKEESADLLFHLLVNLRYHKIGLAEVVNILEKRNGQRNGKAHPK